MLAALGARLLDADGRPSPTGERPWPGWRRSTWRAAPGARRRPPGRVVVACDVDNPLLGPRGAAAVYGPQKGADAAQVRQLDDALGHWADLVATTTGADHRDDAGAGAAGGVGFGASPCSGAGAGRASTSSSTSPASRAPPCAGATSSSPGRAASTSSPCTARRPSAWPQPRGSGGSASSPSAGAPSSRAPPSLPRHRRGLPAHRPRARPRRLHRSARAAPRAGRRPDRRGAPAGPGCDTTRADQPHHPHQPDHLATTSRRPSGNDLVIRAPRVLTAAGEVARCVAVKDGRVVAIEPLGSAIQGEQVIELADDEVLLPGLVDTHVHVNEPGRTEWEGFATATRAAAAGGVTTIIDMPLNCIPPTVTVEALEIKRAVAADQAWRRRRLLGRCGPREPPAPARPARRRGLRLQVLPPRTPASTSSRHLEPEELRARRSTRSPPSAAC